MIFQGVDWGRTTLVRLYNRHGHWVGVHAVSRDRPLRQILRDGDVFTRREDGTYRQP